MAPVIKAAIESSALIRRVNRQLEKDGLAVRRGRGQLVDRLGNYFLVSSKNVVQSNVNLERIAREKQCLEDWEILA